MAYPGEGLRLAVDCNKLMMMISFLISSRFTHLATSRKFPDIKYITYVVFYQKLILIYKLNYRESSPVHRLVYERAKFTSSRINSTQPSRLYSSKAIRASLPLFIGVSKLRLTAEVY